MDQILNPMVLEFTDSYRYHHYPLGSSSPILVGTMAGNQTMIDLHSHLLAGLDDGPRTLEQSLQMARMAFQDGTTTLACTPHCVEDACPSRDRIGEALVALESALPNVGLPDLRLLEGAEMMIGPNLALFLERNPHLTYGGTGRYCLVELPLVDYPLYTARVLFDLVIAGLQPILAHPERNARLQKEPHLVGQFVERGIWIQVNAASFLGHYGSPAERVARDYLHRGWVHIIASDGHNVSSRPPVLSRALKEVGWSVPAPGLPEVFP